MEGEIMRPLVLSNIDYVFLHDPPKSAKDGIKDYDAPKGIMMMTKPKWEDSNQVAFNLSST